MPTGCRSVYLSPSQLTILPHHRRSAPGPPIPGGDFEGGAKDLGTHKLRHGEKQAIRTGHKPSRGVLRGTGSWSSPVQQLGDADGKRR